MAISLMICISYDMPFTLLVEVVASSVRTSTKLFVDFRNFNDNLQ